MNSKLQVLSKSFVYVVVAVLLMRIASIIAGFIVGFASGTCLIDFFTAAPHVYPEMGEAIIGELERLPA